MAAMQIDISEVVNGAIEKIKQEGYTVQKWIPCSERLPESSIYVLCAGRDGMGILRYTGATWLDENAIAYTTNEITHWMLLPNMPEPPKE